MTSGRNSNVEMDVSSYVLFNRRILRLVGLYPRSGGRSLVASMAMLLIVAPQSVRILENRRDLGTVLETSSVLFTVLLALLKLGVWTWKRDEIDALIDYMLNDYWNLAISVGNGSPSQFLLRYATLGKKFTRLYLLLVVNALLLFFGPPLIEMLLVRGTRIVPFPATYPETWMSSPFFEMILVSQMIATSACAAVLLAVDTLVATALFHTCGQFDVIRENFKTFVTSDDRKPEGAVDGSDSRDGYQRKNRGKFAAYIHHHRVVLEFSKAIENTFSPIMFCQVLASNLIICLVGLQMSTTTTDRGKVVKYSAYLLMALFQLVLFCLPGDDLIDKSLAVGDAVYETKWYEASELSGAEICLIIARAQRPAEVTAGKFYVMCLANFATVLSTSMSYFTVLRSMN